jgi:hypothetical protein
MALCSELGTGVALPPVDMKTTNNWYMMDPPTMKAVMDYIDELVHEVNKPSATQLKQLEALKKSLDNIKNIKKRD